MDIILTNNRDRKEYKVKTYDGIVGKKINEKKRVDITVTKEGIVPFLYIDKDKSIIESYTCVSGSFYLNDKLIKPGSKWCATKLDVEGNMIEWGYCIDKKLEIKTLNEALEKTKDFLDSKKQNSFITGYLKTYIFDQKLQKDILNDKELKELLRNKEEFPDVKKYEIDDEITVKGIPYILKESLEFGKYWSEKKGFNHSLVSPSESEIPIKEKPPKKSLIKKREKVYGTNRGQTGEKIVHTYRGIISKELNLARRGKERRIEKTKECILPFDYINSNKERVSTSDCVNKGMTIQGHTIRYPGDPWCATEVDDTGLMKEWGFCTREKKEGDILETEIWEKLCNEVKFEKWNNVSKIIRELLLEGYSERNILNILIENCNKIEIGPYFEQFKQLVTDEFIKLYPWILIKSGRPNKELLKPKKNIKDIVFSKLEYLEGVFNLELRENLISDKNRWLIYYYFLIERIIVEGILSPNGYVDVKLIEKAKKIEDLSVLNNGVLNLEKKIKKQLKKYIEKIDSQGVNVNFKNSINSLNNDINDNIIIVNYGSIFGEIEKEKRVLYFDTLNLESGDIPIQLMYYNISFVEPREELTIIEKKKESEIIIKEEKKETQWKNSNIEYYSNYPETNDPQFFLKIQKKQEFRINKMESWANKKIEDLCRQDTFELSPQQQWISNYFNVETPYKGLLLWWGTGVGKTCASISIAERHLDYYKKYNKKILVILGTSTLENYKKELYNFKKEKLEIAKGLIPGSLQCTKNRYYIPIDSNNPVMLKKREQKIQKRIEQDYEFVTYGSLKGIITKLLQRRGIKLELEGDIKKQIPKKIPSLEGEEITIGESLFKSVRTIKGLIWKKVEVVDEVKEKRIKLAISEYFSNRLIIVDEIQNIRTAGEGGDQIAPQMLEKIIHYSDDVKLVMMSATPMFNNATEILYILNLLLENDGLEKVKQSDLFDSKGNLIYPEKLDKISRGYISYVRGANPISFPLKKLPNQSENLFIKENNEVYYPKPRSKMNGEKLEKEEYIKFNPLIKCNMSNYQETIFKRAVLGESDEEGNLGDETNETFDIKGKVICNIVYPNVNIKNIDNLYGETGFTNCFDENNGIYSYKTENALINGVPFIDYDVIDKYSVKFKKILDNILHTEDGIIFVYSEYKRGGTIPFSLMLEQNGFEQVVVEGKYGDVIVKNRLNSPLKRKSIPQFVSKKPKWRYVVLDGDLEPKKRAQILEKCNSDENKNGNLIKVIVGTRVAGEGVDFARIRQIHILNPWDNLSRIDQIIGRGIRNCSHKDLPEKDRNVTVFLYSGHMSDNSVETTDEKIHRRAERKDIQMKGVEIILRNNSIDCVSNYLANKYTIEDFGSEIGDKDGTRNCAYGDCNELFICKDKQKILADKNVDLDTYNVENHAIREINNYKSIIKQLFEVSVIYDINQIKKHVSSKIKLEYDDGIFLVSLDKLISTKEQLHDKYKRLGTIIFKDGYYLFQPDDLSKSHKLPIYYRETPLTIKPSKVELEITEKSTSEVIVNRWMDDVKLLIEETDDVDELAYELDRVKDSVMKKIILEWFDGIYDSSTIENNDIHEKITDYLYNKNVIIMDEDGENIIAIYWNKTVTYEYLYDTKELVEHINSETFKPKPIIYNFNDYPFDRHLIGKLEKISEGRDDSYQHEVAFKIIDFSFLEERGNLRLDGKACMSYNKGPIKKLLNNLGIEEIQEDSKRKEQCKQIELILRKYNRENLDGKVWWIESNLPYILEK